MFALNHLLLMPAALLLLAGHGRSPAFASISAVEENFVSLGDGDVPFTENRGQWPGHVRYAALAGGSERWVAVRAERGGVALQVEDYAVGRGALLRLEFDGGGDWMPVGLSERPERHHVFVGKDPEQWVRDVRVFEGVVFVDGQGAPRAELFLADGRLELRGAEGRDVPALYTDGAEGMAELLLPWRELWAGAKQRGGHSLGRDPRNGKLRLPPTEQVSLGLDLGLVWSTYLGGSPSKLENLSGVGAYRGTPPRVLVSGRTNALDFPVTAGAWSLVTFKNVWRDVFVASFDADSGALVWSTLIGGAGEDDGVAVDSDADGNVYVAGWSQSKDFPTTPGAYQESFEGNVRPIALRLSPDGSELLYSTFLGGTGLINGSRAEAMRVRPDGAAVLVGRTSAPEFPVTQGAYQTTYSGNGDAFVTVLSPDGSQLEWSTFLGAEQTDTAQAVAIGADGSVTVAGLAGSAHFPITDGAYVWNKPPTTGSGGPALFVTRLSPDGSTLQWSAMIGWSFSATFGPNLKLALGPDGRVALGGMTSPLPIPLPTTPGALQGSYAGGQTDGFVLLLSAGGSQLLAGTYLGGLASDSVRGLEFDSSGVITIAGGSASPHAWLSEPVLAAAEPGGAVYLARLAPDLSRLLFGQVFGGPSGSNVAFGMALLPRGHVVAAGQTSSTAFPVTPGAFQDTPPGGSSSFVLRHRMLPAGVHPLGRSGPACATEAYLGATGPAQAGNTGFALYASGLPPTAPGWLALGRPAEPAVYLPGGPPLHVDPAAPFVLLPWNSGPGGYAVLDVPLPPAAAGLTFGAQIVVLAPTACDPAAHAWTHALTITVGLP